VSSPTPPPAIGPAAPLVDLLDAGDSDWAAFLAKDPAWYLKVAGDTIRKYIGWHLYPSLTVTEPQLEMGAKGIIPLPSRYVTDVASVTVFPQSQHPCTLNPDSDYLWFPEGYIVRTGYPWFGEMYTGYYYGNDPYYLPVWQSGWASITFTHGYNQVPDNVKEVAYELALSTLRLNASNTKEVATPGFRQVFSQPAGMTLNSDQKNRLANYRVGGFK
jgi:hypothetical protein